MLSKLSSQSRQLKEVSRSLTLTKNNQGLYKRNYSKSYKNRSVVSVTGSKLGKKYYATEGNLWFLLFFLTLYLYFFFFFVDFI